MTLSGNISGYKIQTLNLVAGLPQEITGPGRGFEILQPGEAGTRTVIQAQRQAEGQFSDNTPVQAFDSTPGLRVVNYDKLVLNSPVDSQMKVKIYTAKNVATVETGASLIGHRTVWSTNVANLALAAGLDPYEISGPDSKSGTDYFSRGDGLRELKYSDRSAITTSAASLNEANSFSQIHNTEFGFWGGWIANATEFYMEVYAATYNPGTSIAVSWRLVQSFKSTQLGTGGTVPSTDGSQTFADDLYIINFDGQDTKDYSIPSGSLRCYLTGWTSTSSFTGILSAKALK